MSEKPAFLVDLGEQVGHARERLRYRRRRARQAGVVAVVAAVVVAGAMGGLRLLGDDGESSELVAGAGTEQVPAVEETVPGSGTVQVPAADDGPAVSADVTVIDVINEGGWQDISTELLSPRADALGVWTGSEVLIIGGEPGPSCPPIALCTAPEFPPLSDGAAFDPVAGSWRPIADAPVPLDGTTSAVVHDGLLYVMAYARPSRGIELGGFFRYSPASDTWEELPSPDGDRNQLVKSGDTIIAYRESDEEGEVADIRFDIATGTWSELPPDPLSPSFDRLYVDVDGRLFLFAKDIVRSPRSESPNLARIAEVDVESGEFTEVGKSEILWTLDGQVVDSRIVFPYPGSSDGGQVNNWGRSYPYGGIYDPGSGEWEVLPDPATDENFEIAGVVGASGAAFIEPSGMVLDLESLEWIELPASPDSDLRLANRTVVTAGQSLFVFGGEFWADRSGEPPPSAYLLDW